jgi:hypothetical protein
VTHPTVAMGSIFSKYKKLKAMVYTDLT